MIKGIIGFEDISLSSLPVLKRPSLAVLQRPSFPAYGSARSSFSEAAGAHEVEQLLPANTSSSVSVAPLTVDSRGRSFSDPFLDPSRSPLKPQHGGHSQRSPAPPPPISRRYETPNKIRVQSTHVSDSGLKSPTVDSPLLGAGSRTPEMPSDGPTTMDDTSESQDVLASLGRASRDKFGGDPHLSGSRSLSAEDARLSLHVDSALDTQEYDQDEEDEDLSAPRLRLWTFPAHITDMEIDALLKVFPPHISKGHGLKSKTFPLPRPASLRALKAYDAEAGAAVAGDSVAEDTMWPTVEDLKIPPHDAYGLVAPGTGRLWISDRSRQAPWNRTLWARFIKWLLGLFGA